MTGNVPPRRGGWVEPPPGWTPPPFESPPAPPPPAPPQNNDPWAKFNPQPAPAAQADPWAKFSPQPAPPQPMRITEAEPGEPHFWNRSQAGLEEVQKTGYRHPPGFFGWLGRNLNPSDAEQIDLARKRDPEKWAALYNENNRAEALEGATQRQMFQGVPILGAAVGSDATSRFMEQQHPGVTAANQIMGGLGATAPFAAAAPVAFGLRAPAALKNAWGPAQWLARAGIGGTTAAGTGAVDQAARQAAAPLTGQPAPNPTAVLDALGAPTTGSRVADAAVMGAAANTAGQGLGTLLGTVIAPQASHAARWLYNRGMNQMTMGQAAGGTANAVERGLTAIPFGGIGASREAALPSYNRAMENWVIRQLHPDLFKPQLTPQQVTDAVNQAGQNIANRTGQPYTPKTFQDIMADPRLGRQYRPLVTPRATEVPAGVAPGFDGRKFVRETIQKEYNDIAGKGQVQMNLPLQQSLAGLVNRARTSGNLSEVGAARFAKIIDNDVVGKFNNAAQNGSPLHGNAYSTIDTTLRETADAYRNGTGDERVLGRLIEQARSRLQDEFANQNPGLAARLSAADRAWGAYARMRTAGVQPTGEEGLITPSRLNQAAYQEDKSFGKTRFSEGDASMQDWAHYGAQVIGEPRGSDFEKLAVVGGLAAGVMEGHPAMLAVPAATQLAYSRPAQWAGTRYMMHAAPWIRGATDQTPGQMGLAYAMANARAQGMKEALGQPGENQQ